MIIFRNILAIIVGFVVGAAVNSMLVSTGPIVFPPPEGVDLNPEKLAEAMPLLKPEHFVFPFLAHALGTLVGALVAYLIAGSRPRIFANVIGALFLTGGLVAVRMYPAPIWFIVIDLAVAYVPMAALAILIGGKLRRAPAKP